MYITHRLADEDNPRLVNRHGIATQMGRQRIHLQWAAALIAPEAESFEPITALGQKAVHHQPHRLLGLDRLAVEPQLAHPLAVGRLDDPAVAQ